MPKSSGDSEGEFARLAEMISKDRRVDPPDRARAKGFGSKGLKVARKLFAFHSSKGRLVVKLPADRVEALVSEGNGERFDPGHGRLMKEWLAVGLARKTLWLRLLKEGLEFAAGGKGRTVTVPGAPRGGAPALPTRRRSSSAARR
jgi:hypothetical protein